MSHSQIWMLLRQMANDISRRFHFANPQDREDAVSEAILSSVKIAAAMSVSPRDPFAYFRSTVFNFYKRWCCREQTRRKREIISADFLARIAA